MPKRSDLSDGIRLLLYALVDPRVSRGEQKVLAYVFLHRGADGRLKHPASTVGNIVAWTKMDKRRVRRERLALEKHGYLSRHEINKRRVEYSISDTVISQGYNLPGSAGPGHNIPPSRGYNIPPSNVQGQNLPGHDIPGSNSSHLDRDPGIRSNGSEGHDNRPSRTRPEEGSKGKGDGVASGSQQQSSDPDEGNSEFDWWRIATLISQISGVNLGGFDKLFLGESKPLFQELQKLTDPQWVAFATSLKEMKKNARARLIKGRTDYLMRHILKTAATVPGDSTGGDGDEDVWAIRAPLEERLAELERFDKTPETEQEIEEIISRLTEIGT